MALFPFITRCANPVGNPGDAYIGWGLKWLLEETVEHQLNWLLLDKFSPQDFEEHLPELSRIGYCVYAGTPQFNNYDDWIHWYDHEMYTKYIIPNNIKFYAIGGGSGAPRWDMSPEDYAEYCLKSKKTVDILRERAEYTKLFIVRDPHSHALLNALGIENFLLPCPALFATKNVGLTPKLYKSVIVTTNPNVIAPPLVGCETREEVAGKLIPILKNAYNAVKQYTGTEPDILCHGSVAYTAFREHFPIVHYSNDPITTLRRYADYNIVVSMRLHGSIPAYSMGAKVVLVQVDSRASAATILPGIECVPICDATETMFCQALERSKPMAGNFMEEIAEKYKILLRSKMLSLLGR